MSKKKSHYRKTAFVFEELEPRLLLSADPLAVATDANAAVEELVLDNYEDHGALVQTTTEQAISSVRTELVIIDSRAPNYQQLHNDLIKAQQQGRNIHVVVLDAHRDGIEQINEVLASHDKLDAVHIVSHGDDGQLQLGTTQLNKTTLRDHASDIAQWKDRFTDDGDLLIYGCNLAETAEGKTMVDALGYLTATDVAASDDLTGNRILGGDWELEYEAGDIESSVAFSEDVQQNWQGTLEGVTAGAEQEKAPAEEQQQEQQAQLELSGQQAVINEEEHAAISKEEEQQTTIAEAQRQEVVFIDDSVSDFQAFIDDLQANRNSATTFEIILLDSDKNGIDQINETLSGYNEVDALHIISHGYDGTVKLGDTWLSVDNLEQHNDSLSTWSNSLTQDADILIYGCNLAESVQGEQFVAELAQLTGADVAASNDITGHASLGGDWDLEYKAGVVETKVAFSEDARQSWASILNTFVVTSTADSGVGSLRQAILDANSNVNGGTPDLITFNIAGAGPHIINLTSALPTITEEVVIDATAEPDYAGNPVVRIEGAAAGAGVNGLTFAANSDRSIVRGLMITGFTGYGIQVDAGADGITIANNWIGTTGTGSTGVGNSNSGINIQGANTIVGGPGANDGNVITNNGNEGINVTGAGATGTIIQGNIIGLDPDGSTGSGNTDVGIALLTGAHNTIIGGSSVAERNVISNNFEGIEINSNNNVVQGNYIGTDISGMLDRGNRSDDGIEIQNNATGNLIGGTVPESGNLIAFNARDGVYVASGTGNAVLGNRIHSNTELGIDLGANGVTANDVSDTDTGANNLQNFPLIASVSTNGINTIAIDGSINSTASTSLRIEFFASTAADASGHGEAERYLGSVNVSTDAGGNAAFSVNFTELVANGEFITATATVDTGGGNFGSSSEFAQAVTATLTNFAPTLHDWYDANWDYRKEVAIDATRVDANLTDFPVLITLNADADLAMFAQADGDDILFTAADGTTRLAHEIESFDAVTGALTAWVKTDLSALEDTKLFLYYGNSAASNQQDAANVWDSSYMGVWHLNDTPTGAAGDINDSTANNNDGTTEGAMDAADSVTARIGAGLDFDEVDDLIRMQDSATLDSVNDEATIELWIWFDDASDGDHQFIMSSSNRFSASDGYEWASQGSGNHFFYPDAMPVDGNYNLGPNPFTDQQWHHLAMTMNFESRDVDIYVDGTEMAFDTEGVLMNWTTLTSSSDWLWGGNPDRASRYFDGMMDEIRVSDVVRSQGWIQTSINNQSDPSTFFSLVAAESRALMLTAINQDDTDPAGDTVLSMLNSGGGDRVSDVDAGALEGIAVVGVDDSNGQWQYDASGGGTWLAFGAVSNASAVLLDTGAMIRFVPNASYNGPAGDLTFRAWDQTSGANGDTAVNVDVNGGVTAYSTASYTASLTVNPGNDAPVATNDPGDYSTDVLALSPEGYWRLGESAGISASDIGSNANSGTFNGVTLGQAGAIAGDTDTAVSFDGIDDYLEIPHDNSYLLDDGTVQFWFNTTDVNQRADLFSKDALGNVTGGHLSIYLDGTGNIETRLQSASADYFVNSTAPLTNNQWHHVAFSFGTGGMQLYIDGQFQDNDAYTGGLGATSGGTGNFEPIAIGSSTQISGTGVITPLQDYYTGYIDEVALFGSALSADQIQDLYASALQNYTIVEDTALVVSAAEGVLINDADTEGDPLTAVLVAGPTNAASFNLNPDGSFNYTPAANFSGTDSFTYMANDGSSNSNVATVTITVTSDNDAPINTVPGTQVVVEDTQTPIAGISVADPDAGANVISTQLTVTNGVLDVTLAGAATISAGTNGSNTLTISGNVTDINATLASLHYTGNANVNGTAADSLTVVTNDLGNTGTGGAQSDSDSVQINITAVNDVPNARDDRVGLLFDGVDDYVTIGNYAGLNVTTNVTTEAWIKPTGLGTGTKIIINKEGEYEMAINADTGEVMWAFDNIDPDWSWHYTGYFVQAGEWTHLAVSYNNGVVDTFANGVLVDSYNGSGAITDNYPAFNQLQIGGRENVITQRFDGHIDEVRIWNTTRTQLDIQTNMNTLLTGAEPGLIGNWRFDEGSGITVEDQSVFAHHGTLADGITVGEMPAWRGYVVSEEGTLSVSAVNGVLANDYDIDGDGLIAVLVTGPTSAAAFSLNPDGSFTYTPAANFNGVDTFTYRANDGSVDSNIATVTIRVDPVNDVPVAIASTVSTTEDNAYSFSTVDFTYFDTEGDALVSATITNLTLAGGTLTHSGGTMVNSGETLTAAQLDTLVYTPLANATGTPLATFDFSVNDAGAGVTTARMSINVTAVNDVPEAIASTVSTTEDNAYSFTTVDFTYFDTEGDALVSATLTNLTLAGGTLTHSGGTTVNSGDTLTAAQLNTLVYTPLANANGTPLATFDFSVNDAGIGAVSAQMSVNVTAQPDAALIGGVNSGAVTEDDDPDTNNLLEVSGALTIIDPDAGEAVFNAGAIGGTYGVITLNAAGGWGYAAINNQPAIQSLAAGATLTDTITISSADGSTHDIVITIMGTNDAPVAGNDVASVNEGGSVLIDAAATDSDIDNALDLNSIIITGLPGSGSVVVNGDGTVTYTHDGSETLVDSFSYTISDISGAISNTATVTLSINPVNDAPTTSGIADVSVNEDAASTSIDLNAAFADSDNLDSELSYSILGNSNIGLFAATGIDNATGQLTLDYAADMNGAAQISIRASDPSGSFVDTLFSVNVAPVNDNPMLLANTGVMMTGTEPATISSAELNVTDIDNLDSELLYTITELPAHGDLMRNGLVMAVNDTFTQAELDSNLVVYTSRAAVVADRFGFTVSDNAGGALVNNTFSIFVQLNQDSDDGSTSEPPAGDTQEQEDTREEDTGNIDNGGSTADAVGFGGGYEPFGSTSVPPPPAPAPVLTIDPPPQPVPEQETPVEPEQHTATEIEQHEVSTFAAVQVKSIDALWSAIDKMKQEMAESADEKTTTVEFQVAAAKSSGVVLTAGVVAWILRSGALLSSLLSTIPLWKGYDPLPILAYKDDDKKDREEEIDEHKIPTSLEDLRKLKKLMQQQNSTKEVDVDSMFGDSTIRE